MDWFYVLFCVLLDFLVLMTIPLYGLILYSTKRFDVHETGKTFQICLRQLSLCLITQCLVSLLIDEPANLGFFREFFSANAWWIGKISQIGMIGFFVPSGVWMFILALTRLAVIRSAVSIDRGANKLPPISWITWSISLLSTIPLIYPLKTSIYEKFDSSFAYQSLLSETLMPIRWYYNGYRLLPNLFVASTIIIYLIILGHLPGLLRLRSERNYRVYRVTLAAMFSCTGSLITIIAVSIEMIPWLVIGERIWSVGAYYSMYKLGSDVHCIGIAWVTLFMFRKIRRQLLQLLGLIEGSHGKSSQIIVSPQISRKRTQTVASIT